MKIYIAGKVTGIAYEALKQKFQTAANELTERGYSPVNPIELVANPHTPWQKAMKTCISALVYCDGIYVLPDWIDSPGAALELQLAYELKLKITFQMEKYTVTTLNQLNLGDRFYRIGDPKRIVHQVVTHEGHFKKASDVWVQRGDHIRPMPMRDTNTVVFLRHVEANDQSQS